MSRILQLALLAICSVFFCGCQTMGPHARAGSGIGGSTGALAGAAIGSHRGNTLEGAIIGGALGTLAGATIGDSADEMEYRNRLIHQNEIRQVQQAAVTADQLIQMTASGLSDELIINQIQTSGCASNLSTNDLIALKQRGVSDRVISAYQNGWSGYSQGARPTYRPAVVIPYGRPPHHHRPYSGCPNEYCFPGY